MNTILVRLMFKNSNTQRNLKYKNLNNSLRNIWRQKHRLFPVIKTHESIYVGKSFRISEQVIDKNSPYILVKPK